MNELLPLATSELPGIGGVFKTQPGDFVVEELPLYAPAGSGEHVYLTLRREGRTTRDLVVALGRLFHLPSRAIGCAGQKDKIARVTQTFSLHLVRGEAAECAARVASELGCEVLAAARHANKLRTGHLLGNRFRILVREVQPGAAGRARAILDELERSGLPNAFGAQRFGARGDNAERARELFLQPKKGWSARFLYSAWQSWAFHLWLARRHARGALPGLLDGDVAKRSDGALFDVEDLAREEQRRAAGEIVPSGPLFGSRMRWAKGAALELEQEVLAASGFDAEGLSRAGLEGTRRAAWIRPRAAVLESCAEGLWVGFELPKGSYATVVLRELMKNDHFAGADAGENENESEDQ